MKKLFFSVYSLFMAVSFLYAADDSCQKIPNGIVFSTKDVKKTYTFYTDRIVGVQIEPLNSSATDQTELVVIAEPKSIHLDYLEDRSKVRAISDGLIVEIDKESGNARFVSSQTKKVYLEETGTNNDRDTGYNISQHFKISPDESLYGLGQFQDGFMDYRDKEILLVQANTIAIVPFLLSTNQYGLLWDNYSKSLFAEKKNRMSFQSEYGKSVKYYFVAGETPDAIISGYRQLTGKAPMFAKSAYGYWQSKERYQSFDELNSVVSEYRKRQYPIDNIVQDWQYWGDGSMWSSMYFEPYNFPNPAQNIEKLHEQNVKLMCSIWPAVGVRSHMYGELKAKNLLFEPDHWSSGKLIDFFHPEAKAIYYKHLKRGLLDNGVDALWLDGTEPEVNNSGTREDTEKGIKSLGNCCLGEIGQYLNAYSLEATRSIYENYRKDFNKRLFILTRSAFAGQQRNAAVTWSGDIGASWDIFRKQISAGLNFCMAGIPYWSHDIGAFFPSGAGGEYAQGIGSPAYRELYARWFQFGVFSPVFRAHGTGTPREIYRFENDKLAYESILKGLALRYRLMPYIYANAWRVYNEDYTLMRALPMDFTDKKVREIDDTYMFGPSLLVQPITKAMYYPAKKVGNAIPTEYLRSRNGEKGLSVEYFNDMEFKNKVYETVHKNIDFNWGGIAPEKLSFYYFSMRWQGKILPPVSGEYELSLVVDDGARVWIDDELVLESWEVAPARHVSKRITFEKGKEYDVLVDYFQEGGGSEVKLAWRLPDELQKEQEDNKQNFLQSTYLPSGTKWYDFWTGTVYKGGRSVTKEYPLDIFPLFVKAGTILPMGPSIQYANEQSADPVEIRIYKGEDASFVYYEDDGETYDYEQGKYATIEFTWNDQSNTLDISDRKGNFPGVQKDKTFHIVVVDETNGIGVNSSATPSKQINYSGEALQIKL